MPLLSDKLVDPVLGPRAGASVTVRTRSSPVDLEALAFLASADQTITGTRTTQTDTDGSWSLTLPGNLDLDPTGTWYEIEFQWGNTKIGPFAFDMPTTGGPYNLAERVAAFNPPVALTASTGTWTPAWTSNNGTGTVNIADSTGRWDILGANMAALHVGCRVTSAWSGVDVVEVSLPPWFNAVNTWEALAGGGFIIPRPVVFGIHHVLQPVIHPADDPDQQTPPVMRAVVQQENPASNNGRWWAVDGITYPKALDADDTIDMAVLGVFA